MHPADSGAGILFRFLPAFLLISVLASCSGCAPEKSGMPEEKDGWLSVDAPVFARVDTPLILKRGIQRVIYYAGKKGQVMTFQVSCGGLNAQSIHEWKKTEANNLRLSISPAGKNEWETVHQDQDKGTIRRQPLALSPGNFITVTVPLTFLEKYTVSDPAGDRLDVKAELDLLSVTAEPLIYTISVRPAKQQKVREIIFAD